MMGNITKNTKRKLSKKSYISICLVGIVLTIGISALIGVYSYNPVEVENTISVMVKPAFDIPKFIGIICGAIVGLLLTALVLALVSNDGTMKPKYDERQLAARGRAYKAGFFTGLLMSFAMMLPDIFEIQLPVDGVFLMEICVFSGMLVFLGVAIWEHAYYAMNEKGKNVMICFIFVGAFNLLIGIVNVRRDDLIVDGVLHGANTLNLFCGLMFVYVALVTALRRWADKREALCEDNKEDEENDSIINEDNTNGGPADEES